MKIYLKQENFKRKSFIILQEKKKGKKNYIIEFFNYGFPSYLAKRTVSWFQQQKGSRCLYNPCLLGKRGQTKVLSN